jgi:hypothetical protein
LEWKKTVLRVWFIANTARIKGQIARIPQKWLRDTYISKISHTFDPKWLAEPTD